MSAQTKANCGCDILNDCSDPACKGKLLPRFLCCNVKVTPGPYSPLDECCYKPTPSFGFRMPFDCGGYAGGGTCRSGEIGFDCNVRLVGCSTVVSSSWLYQPLTFAGTLPTMSFTVTNAAGDSLAVTINRANVVRNPLADVPCAVCTCATCLPGAFCLTVIRHAKQYEMDAVRVPISASYECVGTKWTVPTTLISNPDQPQYDIMFGGSITLLPVSSGICGIRVNLTLGGGGIDTIIPFEGGLHPRKFHGTLCRGDGLGFTLGTPELLPCPPPPPECVDPPPQLFDTLLNELWHIMDGYTEIGIIMMRDQACGPCVVCPVEPAINQCGGDCQYVGTSARTWFPIGGSTCRNINDWPTVGPWNDAGRPILRCCACGGPPSAPPSFEGEVGYAPCRQLTLNVGGECQ